MNSQNPMTQITFAKRLFAAAALIGMTLTATPLIPVAAAPTVSLPRTAVCGVNPAANGWVPIQVAMEYEARCGSKGGALTAPAQTYIFPAIVGSGKRFFPRRDPHQPSLVPPRFGSLRVTSIGLSIHRPLI